MTTNNLDQLAADLVRAREAEDAVQAYCDNLPADQQYDLGLRVSLLWGASADRRGHELVEYHLNQVTRLAARTIIRDCLNQAKQATADARAAILAHREE